jgi:hypothetical protein
MGDGQSDSDEGSQSSPHLPAQTALTAEAALSDPARPCAALRRVYEPYVNAQTKLSLASHGK